MPNEQKIRTKEEIMKDIEGEKFVIEKFDESFRTLTEELTNLETQLQSVRTRVGSCADGKREAQDKISKFERELESLVTESTDFDGCPKEWQKKAIVFMRKNPGVQMHFTVLLKEVEDCPPSTEFTKARAAMLNLLGHLITKGKVAKGKNGNYSWAVFPKDWKTPAPVVPLFRVGETVDLRRIAEKFINQIENGKEFLQTELEKQFHGACVAIGFGSDTPVDFAHNAQFIEREIYTRAQPLGQLAVYKKDDKVRQGAEVSEHLIISTGRVQPGAPWVRVEKPATRQPAIDTKRRGGSVG